MSKSRKKHPFVGVTKAESEKEDKTRFHKRMRQEERRRLSETMKTGSYEDHITTLPESVSDPWTWAKDGKQMVDDDDLLRK